MTETSRNPEPSPHRHPCPEPRPQPPGKPPRRAPGDRHQAAALAASDGYYVFPLHPRSKVPAIRRWEEAATRDHALIARWWQTGLRNIGIATGPSSLVVLDLDVSHNDPPPPWAGARDGHDVLTRIAAAAGHTVPRTRTVTTPSGGRHLYFHAPDDRELRNTAGRLGWRVDTRAAGGYVVAPGSTLPTGHYELLDDIPVAQLPGWLLTALTPTSTPAVPPRPDVAERPAPRDRAAYLAAIVAGECHDVATAGVGRRHHTLLRAARTLGRLVGSDTLAESVARDALTAAARGYTGVEGYTAQHVDRDITDGLTYGSQLPRHLDHPPAET